METYKKYRLKCFYFLLCFNTTEEKRFLSPRETQRECSSYQLENKTKRPENRAEPLIFGWETQSYSQIAAGCLFEEKEPLTKRWSWEDSLSLLMTSNVHNFIFRSLLYKFVLQDRLIFVKTFESLLSRNQLLCVQWIENFVQWIFEVVVNVFEEVFHE